MFSPPRAPRSPLGRARFAVMLACLLAACPQPTAPSVGLAPTACTPGDDADGEAEPDAAPRPARSVRYAPPPAVACERAAYPPAAALTALRPTAPGGPASRGPLYLRC